MIEDKIQTLVNQFFEQEEWMHCFLVDINANLASKKVEVFVDSDTGVNFRECQKISRFLEGPIDENQWLGEKYTLEVSSPGVSRPLTIARQYPKHIGRTLEVKTLDEKTIKGQLREVKDDGIVLYYKERIKEGKKKRVVEHNDEITFDNIKKAIVKISFSK